MFCIFCLFYPLLPIFCHPDLVFFFFFSANDAAAVVLKAYSRLRTDELKAHFFHSLSTLQIPTTHTLLEKEARWGQSEQHQPKSHRRPSHGMLCALYSCLFLSPRRTTHPLSNKSTRMTCVFVFIPLSLDNTIPAHNNIFVVRRVKKHVNIWPIRNSISIIILWTRTNKEEIILRELCSSLSNELVRILCRLVASNYI